VPVGRIVDGRVRAGAASCGRRAVRASDRACVGSRERCCGTRIVGAPVFGRARFLTLWIGCVDAFRKGVPLGTPSGDRVGMRRDDGAVRAVRDRGTRVPARSVGSTRSWPKKALSVLARVVFGTGRMGRGAVMRDPVPAPTRRW